jgi:hypothetical protein
LLARKTLSIVFCVKKSRRLLVRAGMTKRRPARLAAKPRGPNGFWLEQAEIVEADFNWLSAAERLYLWNVVVPPGFLARLDNLWWLDLQGGSANDLNVARGATKLQYLGINQVRGLHDLSAISEMLHLRCIELYGLPKVTSLPSFTIHMRLERAAIGQTRGLPTLKEILAAPNLRELLLLKKVNLTPSDVDQIAAHPSIKNFSWLAEDVPDKVWVPVVKRLGLPAVSGYSAEDWFGLPATSTAVINI